MHFSSRKTNREIEITNERKIVSSMYLWVNTLPICRGVELIVVDLKNN